jgi:hypothetical protein
MTTATESLADKFNSHLADGGVVIVSTMTHSREYSHEHAGYFSMREADLMVKRGRGRVQLSIGERMMVGIRAGRYR